MIPKKRYNTFLEHPFALRMVLFFPLSMMSFNVNAAFDHAIWDALLSRHVIEKEGGQMTQVDYRGFIDSREQLRQYLNSLSEISPTDFRSWTRTEQLAFLINLYNAWTVELILTEYPDLDSIRDIGSLFRSPWRQKFIPLFGETVSLDYIEHELIRGPDGYDEPRIHFAVNCASIGCPALRTEAYTGSNIERQLEQATSLFLADNSRNYRESFTLYISPIFDWYEEDFEQGWRGTSSVSEFLALYSNALELNEAETIQLMQGNLRIRYAPYDWALNDI